MKITRTIIVAGINMPNISRNIECCRKEVELYRLELPFVYVK